MKSTSFHPQCQIIWLIFYPCQPTKRATACAIGKAVAHMSMKILCQGLLLIVVVTGLTLAVTAALAIATRTTLALYIAFGLLEQHTA